MAKDIYWILLENEKLKQASTSWELSKIEFNTFAFFLTISNYYNHGHNILRLFDTLLNFPFTKGETRRNY